ncbi:MAG: integrase core domain-containing protein [Minisyncoccia bacterium]
MLRPYRPQTNGKVEAFWKIIKREFLTKYFFKDWREFNLKLHQYMYYYNQERKRGEINYLIPTEKLLKLELEDLKGRDHSIKTNQGRVEEINLTSNHFVTELVR